MMPGRRYSEGLHQALEAKEHVEIQPENQTLASITFQNYFRLYKKLAGMTGTALTEASEFMDIYGLDVIEIPTNVTGLPHRRGRRDLPHGKGEVRRHRADRSPTAAAAASRSSSAPSSIEKSEQLSELLKDKKYIQELGRAALDDRPTSSRTARKTSSKYLTDMAAL